MEQAGEEEPQNILDSNLKAIEKAITFTNEQIQKAASANTSAQEAAQLGVDYLFYDHQKQMVEIRKAESDPSKSRHSQQGEENEYKRRVRDTVRTGKLLDSLNAEADLPGIRKYILDRAGAIGLAALPYSEDGSEIEFEKAPNYEADALKKIARTIPDTGVEVKIPDLFAGMDPRFNGGSDSLSE